MTPRLNVLGRFLAHHALHFLAAAERGEFADGEQVAWVEIRCKLVNGKITSRRLDGVPTEEGIVRLGKGWQRALDKSLKEADPPTLKE